VPAWDDEAAEALVEPLGLHAGAVRESAERNPLPKVHIYPDHVFVVLHAPEAGPRGHVHYVELDQFIGPNWLVTVHGPLGEGVDPTAATTETRAVLRRLESGRLRADTAPALSHALVTALTGRLRDFLTTLTQEVWHLQQTVMAGHLGNAEDFLEELFRARHGLLAARAMAALARQVYGRHPAGVPPRRDRVLPDPHQHQDDDRGRAARRHRGRHAARHGDLVDHGHERDRQRGDALGLGDGAALRHGRDVDRPADLGPPPGVVVRPGVPWTSWQASANA